MALDNQTIARPYARALFELADASDTLEQWSEMLELLRRIISDPQMQRLMDNPELGRARLRQLLLDITEGRIDPACVNLIDLLLENGRIGLLPDIAQSYEALKNKRLGSIDVTIISAYAVNKAQEKKLAEGLKKRLGREVRVSTEKDSSLIGGVKIRAGDLVIDGSIRNKLSRLATEFGI
ncbi:MAG: F0F1 ATP synthase subunit delta [Gammaproteobacteria bacterium SHHR-1]|uniref:F0F1 ATP synthase subunit delta n=1 Tax=Magnetovirga frankeli TaxID=947516 RepID=UPI001294018C|nr:F0F1 ATP synthase subunit delta [gamma proteobacterium SS-5]